MSMMIAHAMQERASGKTGQHGITVLDECWSLYDHKRQLTRMDHHAALRSLAYKWVRILFACWKKGIPYQESVYQEHLLQRAAQATANATPFDHGPAADGAQTTDPRQLSSKAPRRQSVNSVLFQFKKVARFCKLSGVTS